MTTGEQISSGPYLRSRYADREGSLEGYVFAVGNESFCLWGYDFAGENEAFLRSFDTTYFVGPSAPSE